jgi:hypothetical protein
MRRLKAEPNAARVFEFGVPIGPDFFLDNGFTIGSVNTKTFILLLAQHRPLSFISGSPVSLARVLKDYNRNEFHHLFPQAYLKSKGAQTEDIQRLVNLAFVSSQDNKDLGGVAPSKYRSQIPAKQRAEILERALCPQSLFSDDYDRFKNERAQLLVTAAEDLLQI